MTYGHLQADCLYTGISSGPNARYRVWEAFTFYLLHYTAWLRGHNGANKLPGVVDVSRLTTAGSRPVGKGDEHPAYAAVGGRLGWRLGLVVARWSRSTKLLYARPG